MGTLDEKAQGIVSVLLREAVETGNGPLLELAHEWQSAIWQGEYRDFFEALLRNRNAPGLQAALRKNFGRGLPLLLDEED